MHESIYILTSNLIVYYTCMKRSKLRENFFLIQVRGAKVSCISFKFGGYSHRVQYSFITFLNKGWNDELNICTVVNWIYKG